MTTIGASLPRVPGKSAGGIERPLKAATGRRLQSVFGARFLSALGAGAVVGREQDNLLCCFGAAPYCSAVILEPG